MSTRRGHKLEVDLNKAINSTSGKHNPNPSNKLERRRRIEELEEERRLRKEIEDF